MTNKRKVYNQLGKAPKKLSAITKAVDLPSSKTLNILKQLHKEGKADFRKIKGVTGWVKGSGVPPKPAPGPKPPPGPKPVNTPSRWKDAPWTKPHVHASHGMRENDRVWSPEELAERCVAHGARAVFAQIGPDCPDPDWARHTRELYTHGRARGLQVGAWGRADYLEWPIVRDALRSVLPLDGYLADIEGPCVDSQLPEKIRDEFADELPLGVIATGGIDSSLPGLTPTEVAARWGDYFDFVGQDYYKVPDLPLTPESGENFVYWRSTAHVPHGFRHLPDAGSRWHVSVAMANAEGTPSLAAQEKTLRAWVESGGAFGFWDAELLEAYNEWDVFARIVR